MNRNYQADEFKGVLLKDDERNQIREYMRSVLGERNYYLAEDFFASIWSSTAKYKVFLARRCLNLMYALYRAENKQPNPELSPTLYSDGALLANIPDIAESYLNWGGFPEIVLVDDLLIHGRTINSLIDNLIEGIVKYVTDKGCNDERSKIESILLDSLTIKIMVQTNKPLLLRDQYYRCLKSAPDGNNIWTPRHWRELSLRISQFILENIFYNTSYVLSLYENDETLDYKSFLTKSAEKFGFEQFDYLGRFKKTILVKPLKRPNGDVVAFYTVRVSQNRINKHYCIVPFVIMADFDCELGRSVIEKNEIGNDLLKGIRDFGGCGEQLKAESLYLLLSHNLLLLLLEEAIDDNFKDNLDIDKIGISFNSNVSNCISDLPGKVAGLNKPFMSWEKMDELILNATDKTSPLFTNTSIGTSTDCVRVIEDAVAEEGEAMEKRAFLEYSKGIFSLQRTGKKPITGLFSKLSERLDVSRISLSRLISKLLEFMDMGSVTLSSKKNGASNEEYIACGFRPGEQSLFILPRRYMCDLPVLIKIEGDCLCNLTAINERIDKLYKETPGRVEELKSFVNSLYDSGQRLIDWDINMMLWSEISKETRDEYPKNGKKDDDKYNEFLLTAQMISNMSKQSELVKRYQELYPEN